LRNRFGKEGNSPIYPQIFGIGIYKECYFSTEVKYEEVINISSMLFNYMVYKLKLT